METPKKQDETLKAILESEQFKKAKIIFDQVKGWLLYALLLLKEFVDDKKYDRKSLFFIVAVFSAIVGYGGFHVYETVVETNLKTSSLDKITDYSDTISSLADSPLTINISAASATVYDLIQANDDLSSEIQRYQKYKESLHLPYTYFLDYIFLPRLNVRKDYYTDQLRIDSFGETFLKENPYIDINLVQKWTDFFSITQQNEINQISNIKIGDIYEYPDGIFGINVTFLFVTPSKNSLWFLLDKLTMTSDQANISLLGEFFYYLREQIKQEEAKFLTDQMGEDSVLGPEAGIDEVLGYNLYNWVFKNGENNLIDNATINRAIFSMMRCTPENENQCFFRFREKYRNIASLAYTMGMKDNNDKVENLRKFLQNIPPLMVLRKFEYSKASDVSLIKQNSIKYNGTVELEIFGKVVTEDDRNEIAKALGMKCFRDDEKILSVEEAMIVIDDTIRQKSENVDEDQSATENIRDLKKIIENIGNNYGSLTNYKKTIRLFEIYRMLNENGLCKVILDKVEDEAQPQQPTENSPAVVTPDVSATTGAAAPDANQELVLE